MAEISVIVPVYKVEKYLDRCVQSILNQTFTDFELILVDDGSPDNCPALCDAYAKRDKRVHVIHQPNKGLSAARNSGLTWMMNNSNSNYVTFVDSDDCVHPHYLKCLHYGAKESGLRISMCQFSREPVDKEAGCFTESDESFEIMPADRALMIDNEICAYAWGRLYQRDLFAHVRFPEGKLMEDLFIIPRMMMCAGSIAVTRAKLYSYSINPKGLSVAVSIKLCFDGLSANREAIKLFQKLKNESMLRYCANRYMGLLCACYNMVRYRKVDFKGASRAVSMLKIKLIGKLACMRYVQFVDRNSESVRNAYLTFSLTYRLFQKIRKNVLTV